MKLASLKNGGLDGTLVIVSRDLQRAIEVPRIAWTLQTALQHWNKLAPELTKVYLALNDNKSSGFELNPEALAAPLPRCYQWLDGSAYLPHVRRVRKARGVELPDQLLTDPLMYQGTGDAFLGPREPIVIQNPDWGLDYESEIGVICDTVDMGVSADVAQAHIQLLVLINDVSLRNLIPAELAKGFGFIHGKPSSGFSPVAVTPDELGNAWQDGKLHLPLRTWLNDKLMGQPNAGEDMQFSFSQLISHAAKTRPLCAGTLIGSGTVSNADTELGCSCLVEKRVLEIINSGEAITPYLKPGDRIRISMEDDQGESIFGDIMQEVVAWTN